jgi:hypothetical protein
VTVPQTGSTAELPALVWAGGVASGGFLGTITQTPQEGVTAVTQYVGTETDRMFIVPEPATSTLLGSGIDGLVLLGALRRRRG